VVSSFIGWIKCFGFLQRDSLFIARSVTKSCIRKNSIVGGSHFCQTEKSFLNRIFLVGKSIQKEMKGILSKQFTRFMDAIKA